MARMTRAHAMHCVNLADVKTWKSAGLRTHISTARYSSLCAKNYEDRLSIYPCDRFKGTLTASVSICYLTSSIGIFETVQRSLGLATSKIGRASCRERV